jgi:prevent-host-death family protein
VAEVTIRELRNHGGDVIDRVERGERLTVTRNGRPVAELRPLSRPPLSAEEIVRRWSRLEPADPVEWRRDLDAVIDPSL